MVPDDARRLATRLSNAFVLDLVKLGAHGRDVIDPLIRSALLHAGVAHVMHDPELQVRYATFDCDVPDELRRPTSINSLATSLAIPFETVRRHVNAFVAEGAAQPSGRGFVVASAVTSSPFFRMACHIQHATLLGLYQQLRAVEAVPATVSNPRDWSEPPLRLAGRYVVEFVLRYRELIAPHVRDVVSSVVFMDAMALNTEALPLSGDGGLGGSTPDGARTPATGAALSARTGIPGETVRRHLVTLCEAGYLARGREGYVVPGALLDSAPFDRLFVENHRNLVRLFGQLASYDALRSVEAPDAAARQTG